jgi:maltose O-acetyltransferase
MAAFPSAVCENRFSSLHANNTTKINVCRPLEANIVARRIFRTNHQVTSHSIGNGRILAIRIRLHYGRPRQEICMGAKVAGKSGVSFPNINLVIERVWREFFINSLAASSLVVNPARAALMRLYGIQTQTTSIRPGCYFGSRDIIIGPGTRVNYRCFFDGAAPIRIGQNCGIGMEVMFCTSSHKIGSAFERAGPASPGPITVGDGCWIGARAVIMPGVTVGSGCVIATGAVVNKDCAPNGLYAGVPARRIKELRHDE